MSLDSIIPSTFAENIKKLGPLGNINILFFSNEEILITTKVTIHIEHREIFKYWEAIKHETYFIGVGFIQTQKDYNIVSQILNDYSGKIHLIFENSPRFSKIIDSIECLQSLEILFITSLIGEFSFTDNEILEKIIYYITKQKIAVVKLVVERIKYKDLMEFIEYVQDIVRVEIDGLSYITATITAKA